MPEELWMEVHNTVHETVIKTIPKKNKCKKTLSEEVLQIAKKRREMKGKGERKRYIQVNAELQRIARIDKKPFLKEHCKEIKGKKKKNRMGKTRDIFKKMEISKEHYMQGWAL